MSTLKELLAGKIPCRETGIEVKQTICDICNPSFHCGIDAYVKDGKVIKIEGTAEHPANKGLLCAKGLANRAYLYREDRIKTPLRRIGERGSGRFEPISWEEAYAEIAKHLLSARENYGPESVVFYGGDPKWIRPYLHRLTYSFGSPNFLTESSSCMTSTFLNWKVTTGNHMSSGDTANAGVYLGWAFNPYYSRYPAALGVEAAKERGMKVIIVDPRITPASQKLADLHLRPRPGTDGALAHGIAHVLIREDRVDHAYIEKYVYGYEQYRAYVMQFDPERVEKLTSVPAADIVKTARMLADHLPMSVNESAAPITHHKNGFQNYRAIMALSAILGCYDRKGGQLPVKFSYNYQPAGFETREEEFVNSVKPENSRPAVGAKRFPLWNDYIDEAQANDLARQIETGDPYAIKALMGFGYNYRIGPDTTRVKKALMQLDFIADVDLFMTDTCLLSDIVLPACTSFERSELKAWGGGYLTCTTPVIEPLYESRSDVQIICDLSKAMHLGDELLARGPDACYRYIIADLPVTLEELKENRYPLKIPTWQAYVPGTQLKNGFHTRSGKFELYALGVEPYRHLGLHPLPTYTDPCTYEEAEQYPFLLCSGPRLTNAVHTRLHKVPWSRSIRPYPMADICPKDAEKLGLQQEDDIELYSDFGCISVKANISAKVDQGSVYMFHGYSEADVNSLLNGDKLDPYSGFPAYRSNRVGIRKKVW